MSSIPKRAYLVGNLISPFITVLFAFKNFNQKQARVAIIIFAGIFGFYFLVPEEADGFVHAQNVKLHYLNLSFDQFYNELIQLFKFAPPPGTNDDVFLHIISYLVAFFGGSQGVFFLVISIIYSYFFIKATGNIYDLLPVQKTMFISSLFVFFFIWKGFEGINSVRTWTGAWIFFNGAFGYYTTKEKKYLYLVLFAPLVHFAHLLFSLSFWGVYFIGKRPKVYFLILVFSFVFKFAIGQSPIIRDIIAATELGQNKIDAYSLENEDKAANRTVRLANFAKVSSFHNYYYSIVTNLYVQVLLIFFMFRYGYFTNKITDYRIFGLLSSATLLWSITNFLHFVPAVYNRGMQLAGLLILAAALILLTGVYENAKNYTPKYEKINNFLKAAFFPIFLLALFHKASAFSTYLNFKLLVSPFIAFFVEDELSFKKIINLIF